MIQRIQSIYLFISSVLMSLMLILPLGEITIDNNIVYEFTSMEISNTADNTTIISTFPLTVLIALVSLISFVAIFLFKKRLLQRRLCHFNIVIIFGLIGLIAFYLFLGLENGMITPSFPIILPLISIIIMFLASKAIYKDEKLVKSYDRIR